MSVKSVVIATPDAAQRKRLGLVVDRMSEFEVIAQTGDLMNTYNVVEERLPKAVLIADVLAGLAEFEVMRALFSTLDIRWLVVTVPNRRLRRPAVGGSPRSDLFSIPTDAPDEVYERQLRALTRTGLNPRPAAKPNPLRPTETPHSHLACGAPTTNATRPLITTVKVQDHLTRTSRAPQADPRPPLGSDPIILIGASTGGVDALLAVLTRFPQDCPPTLVVQHTGSGFGESLASLLDRQCLPNVLLANGPMPLRQGQILVGAGIRAHLVLDGRAATRVTTVADGPVAGHVPSVDRLFLSALPVAPRVSAALLTGMGRDGADGMKALRLAGAHTLAQDEASCVVYGMPRAAVELGGVDRVLPLKKIAEALLARRKTNVGPGREVQK
ncbi:CheB methylesterase domain-containing protein [Mameliella alba]|uniref:CheB methylesterase domain-containing protein n=1 Tax=Mameliella alba TaxID=561184 RepID=UPI000B52BC45|nr:CheB methylesterase domain-containing protein [Mameliella alba]MBY6122463.1 chemotaxis protein CheB [Mameliella alba]OWV39584.1 chemotaxis protein CheB [Mameliella alba]OWV54706.1 chemotaxis protein CheB [Mameliella alba]